MRKWVVWKDKRFSNKPLVSLVPGQKGEKGIKTSVDHTVKIQYKEKRHTHIEYSVQHFIDKCNIEQYEKTSTQVSILLSS